MRHAIALIHRILFISFPKQVLQFTHQGSLLSVRGHAIRPEKYDCANQKI